MAGKHILLLWPVSGWELSLNAYKAKAALLGVDLRLEGDQAGDSCCSQWRPSASK